MTTTVLYTKISVQTKTLDTGSLVTTTFLNKKISAENKITAENFAARLKQDNLVRKTDLIIN